MSDTVIRKTYPYQSDELETCRSSGSTQSNATRISPKAVLNSSSIEGKIILRLASEHTGRCLRPAKVEGTVRPEEEVDPDGPSTDVPKDVDAADTPAKEVGTVTVGAEIQAEVVGMVTVGTVTVGAPAPSNTDPDTRPQLLTSPGLGEKKITIDNPVSELTCLPIYPKAFSLLLITSTCNNR